MLACTFITRRVVDLEGTVSRHAGPRVAATVARKRARDVDGSFRSGRLSTPTGEQGENVSNL